MNILVGFLSISLSNETKITKIFISLSVIKIEFEFLPVVLVKGYFH